MLRINVKKLWPSRAVLARFTPVLGMLVVGVLAYVWGRQGVARLPAQSGDYLRNPVSKTGESDYDKRVVAWIHDTIPITREELGEFLIARFGAERLDFLVNRRIVELACKSRGVHVTDAMIEAQLDRDLKALSPTMTRKDFSKHVLSRFQKTLFEWKEDVIRPKLMLAQLVEPTIQVTAEDLQKGFEGRYGPKVECRWIVLQDNNQKDRLWEKARESEAEFTRIATSLNLPQLCSTAGKVPAIHKHFGDKNIEQIAFNLQVGEVSPLIGMPDKTVVILKCDKHIPPDLTRKFDQERLVLMEEIRNLKLSQRIPEVFAELRKSAMPKLMLRNDNRQDDLERAVAPEISGQAAPGPRPAASNRVGG